MYRGFNTSVGEIRHKLPDADAKTFHAFPQPSDAFALYAADANHVYMAEQDTVFRLDNIDAKTFQPLDPAGFLQRISNAFIFLTLHSPRSDPKTFEVLDILSERTKTRHISASFQFQLPILLHGNRFKRDFLIIHGNMFPIGPPTSFETCVDGLVAIRNNCTGGTKLFRRPTSRRLSSYRRRRTGHHNLWGRTTALTKTMFFTPIKYLPVPIRARLKSTTRAWVPGRA